MSVPLRADGAAGNVGMQIIGQYGMDDTVLDVAGALEAHGLAEAGSSAFS
jgi:Asp-tRNA(Asn)/Glu-tRNA(Gln) amidotransferase A subunit family amidase